MAIANGRSNGKANGKANESRSQKWSAPSSEPATRCLSPGHTEHLTRNSLLTWPQYLPTGELAGVSTSTHTHTHSHTYIHTHTQEKYTRVEQLASALVDEQQATLLIGEQHTVAVVRDTHTRETLWGHKPNNKEGNWGANQKVSVPVSDICCTVRRPEIKNEKSCVGTAREDFGGADDEACYCVLRLVQNLHQK